MESKTSAEKFREMNPDTIGELVGDEEEAIKRYRAELRLRGAEQKISELLQADIARGAEWLNIDEACRLIGWLTQRPYWNQPIKPAAMEGDYATFQAWTDWVNRFVVKRRNKWPPSYKEAVRILGKPTV